MTDWIRLGDRIDQVPTQDKVSIINMVLEQAAYLFAECNEAMDFCVQYVSTSSVVCGGLNRVIWHPARGFKCDEPYCTDDFIKRFKVAVKDLE